MTQLKKLSFVPQLSLLLILLSCMLVQPVAAQEGQAIGRILSTTGSVTARDLNGALRTLARRSDVFVGDTVITGPNGFAQLRMVDSARISFKEDTEFTFSEYSSDGPGGAADSAIMEMVRGGFRTISGTIGEDNADEYQVNTQFASIGIRGTTHEAVIDAGVLLTGVYDGGTTVANAQGSLDTGEGANFNYSSTFPGQPPQGLLQQPAQLGRLNVNLAANGAGDDGNGDADGGDDDGNDDAGNDGNVAPPGGQQNNGGNLADNENANVDPTVDNTRTVETAINPANNIRSREDIARTGTGTVTEENTGSGGGTDSGGNVDAPNPVLSPVDNQRIASRVGFVLSRIAAPGSIFPGNITSLVSGSSVILAGNDLTSPFTLDAEPPFIFRGAGSFIDLSVGTNTSQGENPYDFEIGIWGSTQNPVTLFSDFTDDSIFQQITNPLVVVSVDPAPLASLTGSVVYLTNFDRVLGGSSLGGGITEFFTAFNVDFTAALITDGVMEFCIGGGANCSGENAQFWNFDYSGNVVNGFVVAHPVDNAGYINRQQASIFGTIAGVFTGDNAEAFVGGFNLFYDADLDIFRSSAQNIALPDTTVDGVFLVEKDLRLNSTDFDRTLNADAFLIQEAYARNLLGFSEETTNNMLKFIDSRSRPRLVIREGESPVSISQINQNLDATTSTAFGVNWERWEGPLLTFTDNLDASIVHDGALDEIDDVAFFSSFNISEMTGITGHYENVLAFMGENNEDARISDIAMSFDINFSVGTALNNIENGRMRIDIGTSDESWLIFFEGGLNRNKVDFTLYTSNPNNSNELAGVYNLNVFSNSLQTDDSNMQGVIVDDSAVSINPTPALLSSFYFRETLGASPRRSVSGLALTALGLEPEIPESTPLEDLPDLRFNNPDIETGGILKSDLVNIGIAIVAAPGKVTDVLTTDDYIIPVFGSNTTSKKDRPIFGQFTPTYNASNPYDLSLERVIVNENNSTSSDTFLRNIGGYNIDWGIWASPGSSNNGLFAYTDTQDLNSNENDFYAMPWLLVNNPQISTFNGTASYSHITDFLGGNASESIQSIFTAFDVNFSTALVSNGFLGVKTNAGNTWEAYFSGAVSGAFLNSTSVAGLLNNESPIRGEIAGVFVSPETADNTAPYEAFAGGFNFAKIGFEDTYYLSGLFLAEREARLNALEIQQMQHHTAILLEESSLDSSGNLVPGSISFGVASHPLDGGISSSTVSPVIGVNDRGSQVFGSVDHSQPFDEVLTGTSDIPSISLSYPNYTDDIVVSPVGLEVDWGFWDSTSMSIMHNQFDATDTLSVDTDLFWANVMHSDALEIANRTGSYLYYAAYEFVGSSSNGLLEHFEMYFNVDFADSTPIGTGYLAAADGQLYWDVDITGGTINGSFVKFDTNLGDLSNRDAAVITECTGCVVADIQGVFTGSEIVNGSGQLEAGGFASAFLLNNSLDPVNGVEYIQGLGILESGTGGLPPL